MPDDDDRKDDQPSIPTWAWIVGGIVLFAMIAGVVMYYRKLAKLDAAASDAHFQRITARTAPPTAPTAPDPYVLGRQTEELMTSLTSI